VSPAAFKHLRQRPRRNADLRACRPVAHRAGSGLRTRPGQPRHPWRMEAGDDLLPQQHLDVSRIAAFGDFTLETSDLVVAPKRQQFVVAPHQIVRHRHQLAENLGRRLGDADVVAQGFRHLVDAVEAFQQGHHQNALRRLAVVLLQFAANQQIEFLVRATQFDVRFHGHRVIALAKGIEKLVNGDGLAAGIALGKIVALQHARHRVARRKLDHARPRRVARTRSS
jgi:hypothetical protein